MSVTQKIIKRFNAKLVSDTNQYDDVYFQLTIEKPFVVQQGNVDSEALSKQEKVSGFCNLTGKAGVYQVIKGEQPLFNCNINAVGMVGNCSNVHLDD